MRILVLGQSPDDLRQWATKLLVGQTISYNHSRMRIIVDGVEFMMMTYDDAHDCAAGLTYQTVLHVDRVPLHLHAHIRCPRLKIVGTFAGS